MALNLYLALKNKRADKTDAMRELVNAADGPFTAEQKMKYDDLRAEAEKLTRQIDEEWEKLEFESNQRVDDPNTLAVNRALGDQNSFNNFTLTNRSPATVRLSGGAPRTFAAMFPDQPLSNDGFQSFNEYLATIHTGMHHPNLYAATGMSEGVGADGGFVVPTEFSAEMLDASLEDEIVRPRATISPMVSRQKQIAGWESNDHSAAIGGFTGHWMEEAGTNTNQKGTVMKITLTAYKLAVFAMATNELLADGASFEEMLGQALRNALGFYMDDAFFNGTGAGQPRGVFNDPALITVAKESGQAADTIDYLNLVKMFSRIHPASVANAVWVANTDTIPQLLQLQNVVKNVAGSENVGGSSVPVLQQDGQGGFTLLTRPVVFTEKVPSLGDLGDISLIDFSQYTVGMRQEVILDKSKHVGWSTDESGYRAILRVDGMGRWSGPVTPKNGASLSWCVTLAERA